MIPLVPLMTVTLFAASPGSISSMKWEKRVLVVSAADPSDAMLDAQRRILAEWKAGAGERDLVVVELLGDKVTDATDSAASIRQRYGLPKTGFAVVLIGKDGGAKLREPRPISASVLEETIDAMPMSRSGER